MKIVDTRDGRLFEGRCIATIPAGHQLDAREMAAYYRASPSDRNYAMLAKPATCDRLVLQRGDEQDRNFYIIPRYPFYKIVEEEQEPQE